MGFTAAWVVTAHPDSFVAELGPRMLPLLEAARNDPDDQERWRRWQESPLPDSRTWWSGFGKDDRSERRALRDFFELTGGGGGMDDMYDGGPDSEGDFVLWRDVWGREEGPERPFVCIQSKDYPVASFFHVLGPRRAAKIPGWCGNFLLTSRQVRHSLPAVEEALTFTDPDRAAAEEQDWLHYREGEESILNGPLRQWRQAAAAGLGLCGVSVHVY